MRRPRLQKGRPSDEFVPCRPRPGRPGLRRPPTRSPGPGGAATAKRTKMSRKGLRLRLLGLWMLSLVACAGVAVLLGQFYRQSPAARVARADAAVSRACDRIQEQYRADSALWSARPPLLSTPELRVELVGAVSEALAGQSGVEGGIWQADAGSLAYAFPTYAGTGPKTDLPAAEREHIEAVNEESARNERPVGRRSEVSRAKSAAPRLSVAGPVSSPHGMDDDESRGCSRL